jgi:hypothetical protein
MMKGKIGLIVACLSVLIIITAGCISSDSDDNVTRMSLEPEVIVSNKLYHQANFSSEFAEPDIWDKFNEVYGGKYSRALLDDIIESMRVQAEELGEKPGELEKCLVATGDFDELDENNLPCYAEKARYEYYVDYKGQDSSYIREMNETDLGPTTTESCWIIVVNWGFEGENLGHIKTYIISAEDFSELYFLSCG